MINEAAKTYPNFKAVATTLRDSKNRYGKRLECNLLGRRRDLQGKRLQGTGDHGPCRRRRFLCIRTDLWSDDYRRMQKLAVNYGAAHGALAMTTPGDTTMASKKEVEAIMGGAGARVQR